MRIRMKTTYAAPERSIDAGKVADLPDKEARDLIAKGFADPADADPAEGTARGRETTRKRRTKAAPAGGEQDPNAGGDGDQGDGDDRDDDGE